MACFQRGWGCDMGARNESSNKVAVVVVPLLIALFLAVLYALWAANNENDEPSRASSSGRSATIIAESRKEATIVARAVSNIRGTETAEANITQCLRQPLSCQSLGLDWERTVRNCHATVEADPWGRSYSDCSSERLHNPPTVVPLGQPQRRVGESLAPSERQNLRPWSNR